MKKIPILVFTLLLALFLVSCGLASDRLETTPINEPESDNIPITIMEPTEIYVDVTLNEYSVRYYDGNDEAFDITVEGNIDSYEVVFLPIESPTATPELDENGFPYAVGQYRIGVIYTIGAITDLDETDIIIEIVDRPPLVNQLVGASDTIIYSEILTSVRWEDEELILLAEDKVVESDYYVAHLNAGDEYSSWLFPLLDEIISYIHELTDLYLPESNEKFYLWFGESRWGYSPISGRDDQTGNLIIYMQDYKISPVFGWTDEEKEFISNPYRQYWMESLILSFAHEYAHVLSFAFLDMTSYSWSHEEGYATFVGGFTKEHFVKDPLIVSGNEELEDTIVDIISDFANNRLEDALSRDDGAGDLGGAGRPFEAMFYRYIFEEFGASYANEIHRVMNSRPSTPSRLTIIHDILGVDISESFPAWFDSNANYMEIYW